MFHVDEPAPGVARLRMDDGKVNAMGPAFVEAFPRAFADAARGGRAVVLAGNAKAFSAGLDLKTLPSLDREAFARFARGFTTLFGEVLAHPRPVVAAVDGPAIAGGAVLALCAD
ncbi:MAG TPA: enoyl-CoA hydratase/isomerase family protein, partial [Candidatus Thermoplasmatota archaeon]|nr:enoyl-CoA hydratase/isomerase family protein [Candidatus Thermoplasmatota archaeon]